MKILKNFDSFKSKTFILSVNYCCHIRHLYYKISVILIHLSQSIVTYKYFSFIRYQRGYTHTFPNFYEINYGTGL